MAGPIPGGLSDSARRALPFVRQGVAGGMSGNALSSALSAAGAGVRRTELLDAIRMVRGEAEAADRLKFVRKDRRPDPARLPLSRTRMLREYGYVVELRGFDPQLGGSALRYATVSSSRLQTIAEIEDAALALIGDLEEYEPFEVATVLVTQARRKGGLGSFL